MAQTGNHKGLTFGIFLAPFHRVGENPTLSMARDMELVEWIDELGYDEAWIGEHHSAGWETIASPEVFIGALIERTRFIRLGSGVTSLPYHHPLMVANRFVQRDHMEQSLAAIMALLKCEEPVTMKTDWFELKEARLHLAPYSYPHFPIACASTITPSGMIAAGKHGVGVLSIGAGLPGGPEAMAKQWAIYEETAAKHGHTADRSKWRIVVNAHIAEDDERALREVHAGERRETVTYFEDTLGRPPGRSDDPLREGVAQGTTLVGSPDTVAKGIERLLGYSKGGFGGILFRAHEWADREATLRSYEMFARYVMPRFQGSIDTTIGSNSWARENRKAVFGPTVAAVKKAFTDVGREVPDEFRSRTVGARDVVE